MAFNPLQKVYIRFVDDIPVLLFGAGVGNQVKVTAYGWTGMSMRASVTDMYAFVVASLFDVSITKSPQTQETLDGAQAKTAYDTRGDGNYLIVVEIYDPATGEVKEVAAAQFCLPSTVVTMDAAKWELKEPVVFYTDQMTGAKHTYQAPLKTIRIPSGVRFASSIYDLDRERQLGRTVIFFYKAGTVQIVDTGWARRALVSLDYEFTDLDAYLLWVAYQALKTGVNKDDVFAVLTNPNITSERKAQILTPYAIRQLEIDMYGRIPRFEFIPVASPPRLSFDIYYDVGFLNVDWNKVIGYALIGAAIVGAVAFTAATFGIGIPVGKAMILGALAGAGIAWHTDAPPSEPPDENEKRTIDEAIDEGVKRIKEAVDEAIRIIKEEIAKGTVTEEAGTRIIDAVVAIDAETKTVLRELRDVAHGQVDEAHRRGRTRGWIEGGGIGGALGALAGGVVGYYVAG